MRGLCGRSSLVLLATVLAHANVAHPQLTSDHMPGFLAGVRVTYEVVTVAGKWRRPARRGYGGCTLSVMRQRGGDSNVCPDEIRYAKATAALFHVILSSNDAAVPPRVRVRGKRDSAAGASNVIARPLQRWPEEEGLEGDTLEHPEGRVHPGPVSGKRHRGAPDATAKNTEEAEKSSRNRNTARRHEGNNRSRSMMTTRSFERLLDVLRRPNRVPPLKHHV